jgi:hypothetical protein
MFVLRIPITPFHVDALKAGLTKVQPGVQGAPRACTPARRRDRGSKGKGGPGGGGSPGLHKRIPMVAAVRL